MDEEIRKELAEIKRLTLLAAKNVFSVKDLAFYLGRSEKTIRNSLADTPHYKDGTHIWFRRDEIESWQCRKRCKPISELLTTKTPNNHVTLIP